MGTLADDEERMLNAIAEYLLGEEYNDASGEEQESAEESWLSFALEGTQNKNREAGEKHYRGVRYVKARRNYAAEIRNPNKKGSRLWLDGYGTPEAAAVAYDRKAFELRGSSAKLNFPLNVESGQYLDPFSQSSSSHTASSVPKKRKTGGKVEGQPSKELG